ncbi:MAG: choice-of-anchor tandem repeat NxxGxxAF-containing protein [Acidobacteriota bacterium]
MINRRLLSSFIMVLLTAICICPASAQRRGKPSAARDFSAVLIETGSSAPSSGQFANFNSFTINDNNHVAFLATVTRKEDSSNTAGTVNGLFLLTDSGARKIALQGEVAIGGGKFSDLIPLTDPPTTTIALNNRDEIAFIAQLEGTTASTGIFLSSQNQLTRLVANGDAAPGGGKFAGFGSLAINDRGNVVFFSALSEDRAGAAVFLISETGMERMLSLGDSLTTGERLNGISFSARSFNNENQLVLLGNFSNTSEQTGLFLATPGKLSAVATTGQTSPLGGRFQTFGLPVINDRGTILCLTFLSEGPSQALFTFSTQGVIKVAATGDITLDGEKIETIPSFRDAYAINNNGMVAYCALLNSFQSQTFFLVKDNSVTSVGRNVRLPTPRFPNLIRFYPLALNNQDVVLVAGATFDTFGFTTTINEINIGRAGNKSVDIYRR